MSCQLRVFRREFQCSFTQSIDPTELFLSTEETSSLTWHWDVVSFDFALSLRLIILRTADLCGLLGTTICLDEQRYQILAACLEKHGGNWDGKADGRVRGMHRAVVEYI